MRSFSTDSGDQFNIGYDDLAALLTCVAEAFPGTVALDAFIDDDRIGNAVWLLYARGMLTLLTEPFRFVVVPGERPEAARLMRVQAARGDNILGSLRHESFTAKDEAAAGCIAMLDGSRSIEDLAVAWAADSGVPLEEACDRVATGLREVGRLGIMVA